MNIRGKNIVAKCFLFLLFWGIGNIGAWGASWPWHGGTVKDHILALETSDQDSGNTADARFDLKPYRGKILNFSIRCRIQNVTKPLHPWNGVKFMLSYPVMAGMEFGT